MALVFGTHDMALFVITAIVPNAKLGADVKYTVTRTLQLGWRSGVRRALNAVGASLFVMLAGRLAVADW